MFVVGLAEIAPHYAEFRINYCCVDNTVVIVVSIIRVKQHNVKNMFIKIVSQVNGELRQLP